LTASFFNIDKMDKWLQAWTGWPLIQDEPLKIQAVEGEKFLVRACLSTMEIPKSWLPSKVLEYLRLLLEYGSAGFGNV